MYQGLSRSQHDHILEDILNHVSCITHKEGWENAVALLMALLPLHSDGLQGWYRTCYDSFPWTILYSAPGR